MAHLFDRLLVAGAGVVLVGALCSCGGEAGPRNNTGTEQTKASSTPDPSTSPAPGIREVDGFTAFSLPSGNVGCVINAGKDVRCDVRERSWSPPPRGSSDCAPDPGSYGNGITISAGGTARFTCARDIALGGEPLAYGDSVTVGVLRCESTQSGMTCRDVGTGHGFSIARESYRLF